MEGKIDGYGESMENFLGEYTYEIRAGGICDRKYKQCFSGTKVKRI